MKLKVFILAMCIFVGLLNSCTKNELENTLYWNQTGCADPWQTTSNDSWETTASALKGYLDDLGIKSTDVEFRNIQQPVELNCFACGCTTGIRILVVVK